jgi:LDH2 family malate/lactate/ureidoglycolate dehydrogenase
LATAYRPTHDYCFELSLVFLIANAINVGHAWRYAANINRRITVSFKKRYTRSRISEELAAEIAEEFVVAELIGTKTHGVGKLVSLQFGDLAAKPNIVERGAVISVDGNGGNGFVLFRQITELVSKRCSAMGIVAAFVHNLAGIVRCILTPFVWRKVGLSAYWQIPQGRRLSRRLGQLIR